MFVYQPCKECEKGYIDKDFGVIKCSCLKEYQAKVKLYCDMIDSNLINPKSNLKSFYDLRDLSLSSYLGDDKNGNINKIKKLIKFYSRKYSDMNLFFSGEPGTQKSTLGRYTGKELLFKGKSVYYILANTLIQSIISAERVDFYKELVNKILTVDFLIIDEMDEDKIVTYESGWQRKHFHPFLKDRLEIVKKSTLFISNRKIDGLGDYFDDATKDLIYRCVADKTMVFEDNYNVNKPPMSVDEIWN